MTFSEIPADEEEAAGRLFGEGPQHPSDDQRRDRHPGRVRIPSIGDHDQPAARAPVIEEPQVDDAREHPENHDSGDDETHSLAP